MQEDKLSEDNIDDKVNPYHNIIINNIDKENVNMSQMEHWSILSNVVTMYSMAGTQETFTS